MRIAEHAPYPCPRLPALFVMTDPDRLPDPLAVARRLPAGCGLVYRHFGDPEAGAVIAQLASLCAQRNIQLMISYDPALDGIGAPDAGVHFAQKHHHAIAAWRTQWPDRPASAAAHDCKSARRALDEGVDAVFLSSVFASKSPSAGPPMGAQGFAHNVQTIGGPVYALGGITAQNAPDLCGAASGLACVSAINSNWRTKK